MERCGYGACVRRHVANKNKQMRGLSEYHGAPAATSRCGEPHHRGPPRAAADPKAALAEVVQSSQDLSVIAPLGRDAPNLSDCLIEVERLGQARLRDTGGGQRLASAGRGSRSPQPPPPRALLEQDKDPRPLPPVSAATRPP